MKALCLVLDSVGIGGAPDAELYGDAGSDTLGHLMAREGLVLPHLASMGLYEIMRGSSERVPDAVPLLRGSSAMRLTERSVGKDTTTGHWELAGLVTAEPLLTVDHFSEDLLSELSQRTGVEFLGNVAASGTAILEKWGAEHMRTGKVIVYTSADSVMQMAAHEDEEIFGIERLWHLCEEARRLLDERGLRVGRVIARPFVGEGPFVRTAGRRDYSLVPSPTVLDQLRTAGVRVVGIGKISDIFAGRGVTESIPTKSNAEGMAVIRQKWRERQEGAVLYLANLVDFDMLYGHRRDPRGYARALIEFDQWLGEFLAEVKAEEMICICADHGNDPYHHGTDHTREQVPFLVLHAPSALPECGDFTQVAATIAEYFGVAKRSEI